MMQIFFRAVCVALVAIACGVKGAPRPVQPATPAPVTVPGASGEVR